MGGVRAPKNWLQKQKKSFIKKALLFNFFLALVTLLSAYMLIKPFLVGFCK